MLPSLSRHRCTVNVRRPADERVARGDRLGLVLARGAQHGHPRARPGSRARTAAARTGTGRRPAPAPAARPRARRRGRRWPPVGAGRRGGQDQPVVTAQQPGQRRCRRLTGSCPLHSCLNCMQFCGRVQGSGRKTAYSIRAGRGGRCTSVTDAVCGLNLDGSVCSLRDGMVSHASCRAGARHPQGGPARSPAGHPACARLPAGVHPRRHPDPGHEAVPGQPGRASSASAAPRCARCCGCCRRRAWSRSSRTSGPGSPAWTRRSSTTSTRAGSCWRRWPCP